MEMETVHNTQNFVDHNLVTLESGHSTASLWTVSQVDMENLSKALNVKRRVFQLPLTSVEPGLAQQYEI